MSSQGESRIDVMRAPFLEEWWDVLVRGAVAVAASAWIAMIVHASGSRGGIVPFGLAFLTIAGAFVATCVACASRRKLPGRNGGELTAERTLALGDRAAFFGFIARVLTLAALGFLAAAIISAAFPGRRFAAIAVAAILAMTALTLLGLSWRGGVVGWVVDLLIPDIGASGHAYDQTELQRYRCGWSQAGRLAGLRAALAQDERASAEARAILWLRYAPSSNTVKLNVRVKSLLDELCARRAGWLTAASVSAIAAATMMLLLAVLPRGALGTLPPLGGLHFWPSDEAEWLQPDEAEADELSPDDGSGDQGRSDSSTGAGGAEGGGSPAGDARGGSPNQGDTQGDASSGLESAESDSLGDRGGIEGDAGESSNGAGLGGRGERGLAGDDRNGGHASDNASEDTSTASSASSPAQPGGEVGNNFGTSRAGAGSESSANDATSENDGNTSAPGEADSHEPQGPEAGDTRADPGAGDGADPVADTDAQANVGDLNSQSEPGGAGSVASDMGASEADGSVDETERAGETDTGSANSMTEPIDAGAVNNEVAASAGELLDSVTTAPADDPVDPSSPTGTIEREATPRQPSDTVPVVELPKHASDGIDVSGGEPLEPARAVISLSAGKLDDFGEDAMIRVADPYENAGGDEVEIGAAATLFADKGSVPDAVEQTFGPEDHGLASAPVVKLPPRQPIPAWIKAFLP